LKIRYRRCSKLTTLLFYRLEFDRSVLDRIRDNECCEEEKKCLSKNSSYHKTALRKKKTRLCRQSIVKDFEKHAKNDYQELIRLRRDESVEKSHRSSIEEFRSRRTKEDHLDQRRLSESDDRSFYVVAFADRHKDCSHDVVVL
jgi:hypothetical protein